MTSVATGASVALTELYLTMARIRAFEAKAMGLFAAKFIRGSVHPYTGEEAVAVGVCAAESPPAPPASPTASGASDTAFSFSDISFLSEIFLLDF